MYDETPPDTLVVERRSGPRRLRANDDDDREDDNSTYWRPFSALMDRIPSRRRHQDAGGVGWSRDATSNRHSYLDSES